jgi:hypothetical protein
MLQRTGFLTSWVHYQLLKKTLHAIQYFLLIFICVFQYVILTDFYMYLCTQSVTEGIKYSEGETNHEVPLIHAAGWYLCPLYPIQMLVFLICNIITFKYSWYLPTYHVCKVIHTHRVSVQIYMHSVLNLARSSFKHLVWKRSASTMYVVC